MITIKTIGFDDNNIVVGLSDGSLVVKPIKDFPNLYRGTLEQQKNYQIKGNGRWVHWQELDEDLSAEGFVDLKEPIISHKTQ